MSVVPWGSGDADAQVVLCVITFRVSRTQHKMCCGHSLLSVSVRGRIPTLLHGPGCNLGEW